MTKKRIIEIFSAGCPVCTDAVALVKDLACPSCDIRVLDMRNPVVAEKAKSMKVKAVPAVAVDGKLAECCTGSGIDEATLRRAGLGEPLS